MKTLSSTFSNKIKKLFVFTAASIGLFSCSHGGSSTSMEIETLNAGDAITLLNGVTFDENNFYICATAIQGKSIAVLLPENQILYNDEPCQSRFRKI